MRVVYGSELLYNDITISTKITGGTATASDSLSQGNYGVLSLTQTDLLMDTTQAAQELANWYASIYSSPEFRFESVEVILNPGMHTGCEFIIEKRGGMLYYFITAHGASFPD